MSAKAGTVLKDNIVLTRQLGEGAMGVVWVAQHRALDAEVAVKLLQPTSLANDEAHLRFQREAKVVAKIDSPHVVRIFDIGVAATGEPYIVMELLKGKDLATALAERGPLSLEETSTLIRQACAALSRAHAAGVVHRDLKPANMFLADGGDGIFVKLLDFGIAKAKGADGLALTSTEALIGTPYYMSPEQFMDPRGIDARSDLWSLSVVAYACVTGKLPFAAETVGGLAVAVHAGKFALPSAVRPELSLLDAWFRRALDPERDRRFQTAAEVAESFARAIKGEPIGAVTAPSVSIATTDQKVTAPAFVDAPTELQSSPRAETSARSSGLGASQSYAAVKDTPTSGASPSKPRSSTPLFIALGLVAAAGAGYAGSRLGRDEPRAVSTSGVVVPARSDASDAVGSAPTFTVAPLTPSTPVPSAPASSASAPLAIASASGGRGRPVTSGPRPTEAEVRAAVVPCWASHGNGKAATFVASLGRSYPQGSPSMSSQGLTEAGTKKPIPGQSAFITCARNAASPLAARLPMDPSGERFESLRVVVSLPGTNAAPAPSSASPGTP